MSWKPLTAIVGEDAWDTPGADRMSVLLNVDGVVLRLHAAAVNPATPGNSVQQLLDTGIDMTLCALAQPEEPWETYQLAGREYVLYCAGSGPEPANLDDASGGDELAGGVSPVISCVGGLPAAWEASGDLLPESGRLTCSLFVDRQCGVFLDAREVAADGSGLLAYPDDLQHAITLSQPGDRFNLFEFAGRQYLLLMYPHGN